MSIKALTAITIVVLASLAASAAHAQSVESARVRRFSLVAGGMGSVFQPDYFGNWPPTAGSNPKSGTSNYPLIGIGAYVDVTLSKWVAFEAEGRWLRFNQYAGINQSNYLIGPKVPVARLGRINFYGKALVGFSTMNFGAYNATGRFTDIAFGGGGDIRLSRKIYLRPFDVEYQYWPAWGNSTLKPYGVSAGIGYRIF